MSSSSLYFISITLLILISTVESVYYAYSYDDGYGNKEHCCFVQTHGKFCSAKPITRSLVQVNGHCDHLDQPKHYRPHGKQRNHGYIDRIVRRLNVRATHEFDDKILIELKDPLEKSILDNDLVCLKSSNNQKMNFDKCYVEVIDQSNDDDNNSNRQVSKKTRTNRRRYRHNPQKRFANQTQEELDVTEDKNKDSAKEDAKNEGKRVQLDQPIRVREGHGFAMRQTYTFNMSRSRPTSEQSKCHSWYRKTTRKLRRKSSKHGRICVRLNDHNEDCINQLVHNTLPMNRKSHHDQQQQQKKVHKKPNISKESKLYCENQSGNYKLLGNYRYSTVCFHSSNQIIIEHEFSDIVGLSSAHKNKHVLEFIAKNPKLTAEINNDCHDETTLVESADLERKVKH